MSAKALPGTSPTPTGGKGELNLGNACVMSLLKEIWQFLRVRKKFWLLPIIIVMLLFGALMWFAAGSALAPFIYTLF